MNLGPKEIRKRLMMGTVAFVLGIGVFVALVLAGVNSWWRIGLLLPFWMATLGFFQAKEKT